MVLTVKPRGSKKVLLSNKSALATKKYVKQEIKREGVDKYSDTNVLPASVTGAGLIFGPLTLVAGGLTEITRVGDALIMDEISYTFSLSMADTTNIMRVIIFQWNDNNAINPPTPALVFQQLLTAPHIGQLNWNSIKNNTMNVISDKVYTGVLGQDSTIKVIKGKLFGKRLPRKRLQFIPATVDASAHIYVMTLSDSTAAPHPTFAYSSRLKFHQ